MAPSPMGSYYIREPHFGSFPRCSFLASIAQTSQSNLSSFCHHSTLCNYATRCRYNSWFISLTRLHRRFWTLSCSRGSIVLHVLFSTYAVRMYVLLPRPVRLLVVPRSSVTRTKRINRPHHSYHRLLGKIVAICLIKTRGIVSERVVPLAASLSVLAECENLQ